MSLTTVVVIVSIFAVAAAMRSGGSTLHTRPRRIMSFVTCGSTAEVLKATIQFAMKCGYSVDRMDEANERLVLSDSISLTSFGFFYPIYLSAQDNATLVEVGIKSKAWQVGPVVTRAHERCFNGLKAALITTPQDGTAT